jgi:hypothetical protein
MCTPVLFILIWHMLLVVDGLAQRQYSIEKPRERSTSERITINTKAVQPSKGVLAVILYPIIDGQVIVKDSTGRVLARQEASEGKAEFLLQRNKIYEVEATAPGFIGASSKSKALGATQFLSLRLVPQYATIKFPPLPSNAQIFIDGKQRVTVGQGGMVSIVDLEPGSHTLLIRHPEYNDYADKLENLEAGATVTFARIPLRRLAILTIEGPAGATVLIDGVVQARIGPDGSVKIDYDLEEAVECTISVELLGYQSWSRRETLTPGPRTITVKLDPVITSAGTSDFFESLSQWNAPPSWTIATDGRNKKLEVRGGQLGTLSNKIYSNFSTNFTIWLDDGKGATWAVRSDKEGRNYYLFHLSGPNSTALTPRRFYTYLVKDGGEPVEVVTPIPVIPDLSARTSFNIYIEVTGSTIKHTITSNDTGVEDDLGVFTDTTSSKDKFLYGTFGFRSLLGEVFSVDDLSISLEPRSKG